MNCWALAANTSKWGQGEARGVLAAATALACQPGAVARGVSVHGCYSLSLPAGGGGKGGISTWLYPKNRTGSMMEAAPHIELW